MDNKETKTVNSKFNLTWLVLFSEQEGDFAQSPRPKPGFCVCLNTVLCTDLNFRAQSAIFSVFYFSIFLLTGTEDDEVVKSKKVFRGQTVASQNSETELMLEGDDDAVSLLQEKEMDNLGGKSARPPLH